MVMPRSCDTCGIGFKPTAPTSRFCSVGCYNQSRSVPKVRKTRPRANIGPPNKCYVCEEACSSIGKTVCSRACAGKKSSTMEQRDCDHCGQSFHCPKSATRKFCTYLCFNKSGGNGRAGRAAAEAIMKKYGAKKDANHKEIFQAIKTLCAVLDLSASGYGVPDGIAYINDGWRLFDVKNPKTTYGRRGLNDRQKRWASDFRGGPVYLIYNVDEAISFARGNFEALKMHIPGEAVEMARGAEQ